MVQALEAVDSDTRLLVENTAGAGRTIGRTAAEVGAILSHIPTRLRGRAGYGLDTCHLYASGYDITESASGFGDVLSEFEDATGEPPSFFHLNDSEAELGSNRDRIGVPLILETPQSNYDVDDDDASADPFDIRMQRLLTELATP